MSKLTLSVDPAVVRRAKKYAAARGTSVSRLVTTYLQAVSQPEPSEAEPPVLRRLRGSFKGVDLEVYEDYLAKKYR